MLALIFHAVLASASDNGSWAFGWANDEFFGTDNQFTNGFWLQRHGSHAPDWDQAGKTLAFGVSLARRLLPRVEGMSYRESWSLGQNMQTPDRISQREIILDDAPFVGMLGWTNTHVAFNDRELTGFQTLIGLVGPATGAEQAQRAAHNITGASTPRGWRNQLDNEPLLNIYAIRKVKIARGSWQDLAIGVDGALGNFFTHAQASLEWRVGRRPQGFALRPTALGRSITYDARLRNSGQTHIYGSMAIQGTALGFALPREGNLLRGGNEWTDNNVLSPRRIIGQFMLGMHYEKPSWALHAQFFISSDSFKDNGQANLADPKNKFGILTFEWSP